MVEKDEILFGKLKPKNNSCPVCDSTNFWELVEINQVPVYCNLLWPSRGEAINAQRGDIRLVFCKDCGHIFNIAFDAGLINYTQQYENSLHFSPRFQEYASSLAERLIENYDLHGKDIVEIGCGKGEFLNILCDLGNNRGVGFDTSYEEERIDNADKQRFIVIKDFFSERYANYKADMICCQHVLEHIQYSRDFMNTIRRTVGNRPHTVLYFEVPNIMYTLKDLGIWDLIYEHCGYFSISSLSCLFNSCGFKVIRISDAFDGQYLCIDALPVQDRSDCEIDQWNNFEEMANYVEEFSERYYSKIKAWERDLEKMKHAGQMVIIWGAGSKGVTFLNAIKTTDQIKYLVDINAHKQGKYVAGTGQEIVPPEFLREYRPDVIIVMNPIYLKEIQQMVKEMNLPSSFRLV